MEVQMNFYNCKFFFSDEDFDYDCEMDDPEMSPKNTAALTHDDFDDEDEDDEDDGEFDEDVGEFDEDDEEDSDNEDDKEYSETDQTSEKKSKRGIFDAFRSRSEKCCV